MDALFLESNYMYMVALSLMGFILLVYVILTMFGIDLEGDDVDVDSNMEMETDLEIDANVMGDILNWSSFNKVPTIIYLSSVLLSFGVTGLLFNKILGIEENYFSLIASLPMSVIGAKYLSTIIGGIIPKVSTNVVSNLSFIGLKATVTMGGKGGIPCEARISHQGSKYFVSVQHIEDMELEQDQEIVILKTLTDEPIIYSVEKIENLQE